MFSTSVVKPPRFFTILSGQDFKHNHNRRLMTMVTIEGCMLLWLVAARFSIASETFTDGTGVVQHAQVSLERGYSDLETHLSLGSPSKLLKAKNKEGIESDTMQEHSFENIQSPLSEERKAKINQNLSRYQEKLDSLRAEGEPMRKMFDVVLNNEEILEHYGQVDEGKSFSLIMKMFKEVRQDINEAIQIRFRTWAGLGGRVLEPAYERETDIQSQKSTHESSDTTQPKESQRQLKDEIWQIINRQSVITRVKDLNNILHDVKFPDHGNLRSKNLEKIRAIKLCFEKCIFMAIIFMDNVGLIEEHEYKKIFLTPRTLNLIAQHIVDLFPVTKYGLYHEDCFVPDIEFMRDHWRTKHLHEILRGLSIAQQSHVVGESLIYNVELFGKSMTANNGNLTFSCSSAMNPETIRSIISNLQSFSRWPFSKGASLPAEENSVNQAVGFMINFFQESVHYVRNDEFIPALMVIECFFNYYVLHFIKTYSKECLQNLFKNKILEKQLELFQEGIKIHQIIKQAQTYGNLISSVETEFLLISKDSARMRKKFCMEQYKHISENYRKLESEFAEASVKDPKAQDWFQGQKISSNILLSFNSKATSWDEGLCMETETRKEILWAHWYSHMNYDLDGITDQEILSIMDPSDTYL